MNRDFYDFSKRALDLLTSGIALLLLSPVLMALAIGVRLNSTGPALFRQERLGRGGRPFLLLKFRSMREAQAGEGLQVTASGDPRITSLGRLLRRYKLDELPQLLNVLVGDMSIVGPRPEVPIYVRHFPDAYRQLLTVRPGLTDPATLAFRDEEAILAKSLDPAKLYLSAILPQKLELSLGYLTRRSMSADIIIILRTVRAIFQ